MMKGTARPFRIMRPSGHSDGDVKMDIVQLLIDGFFILYLGSFVVGMIIGALIPIGLLLSQKQRCLAWKRSFATTSNTMNTH